MVPAGRVHAPTTAGRSSRRRSWKHDIAGVPVHRRAGRRVVRCSPPARDLTGRPALRRAGRLTALARSAPARTSWSTTSAGRSGSTTCCGWPSRPRRCRGHLDPRRVRAGGGRGRGAELVPALLAPHAGRGGWSRGLGRPAGLAAAASRRRWPRTPRCCWPTRRCRPGTRRTPSCRSSSPAARWPAAAASACSSRRRPRPGRPGGWRWPARRWSWRRAGLETRLGLLSEPYRPAGRAAAARGARADRRRGRRGPARPAQPGRVRARPGWRCWPAGSSSASASSTPACSPPRTPSTSSSPSAAGSPNTGRPGSPIPTRKATLYPISLRPTSQRFYAAGYLLGGSAVRSRAARIDRKIV